MTKVIGNNSIKTKTKKGSRRPDSLGVNPLRAFETGLNRRAFLRRSGAAALLVGIAASKPQLLAAKEGGSLAVKEQGASLSLTKADIDSQTKSVIVQVQSHLFPDDGDGPSAADLQAFEYLSWALTDPDNQADGDLEFILQGVGWLEELAKSTHGDSLLKLDFDIQAQLIEKIARSRAGENWLSLLLYYLIEALTLDPVYGGNPNGVGWKWLGHQSGYPAPVLGKTYRDFS